MAQAWIHICMVDLHSGTIKELPSQGILYDRQANKFTNFGAF